MTQAVGGRVVLLDLQQVVEDWVELALGLNPEALHVMDMLISMQHRRTGTGEAPAIESGIGNSAGDGGDESSVL